jgi:hypothetical protein
LSVKLHLDINGWYSTPNAKYDGLSPRDYLRGKSWDGQMQVSLSVLKQHRVISISEISADDLLIEFVRLCVEQGEALELLKEGSNVQTVGKRILGIAAELRTRPNTQRIGLMQLLSHPNSWVRFHAAEGCIDLTPVDARRELQRLADSGDYPVAGHAGMFLSLYDGELSG